MVARGTWRAEWRQKNLKFAQKILKKFTMILWLFSKLFCSITFFHIIDSFWVKWNFHDFFTQKIPMIQKNVIEQKSLEKSQRIGVNFFRIFWAHFWFFDLNLALNSYCRAQPLNCVLISQFHQKSYFFLWLLMIQGVSRSKWKHR